MRCERCGNEAKKVTRLRGEGQYICRRCREAVQESGKPGGKPAVAVPREAL